MNEESIAYCGLVCSFCSEDGSCNCKCGNHCGKRLSLQGCYQFECCTKNGFAGCWECELAPCGIDMLSFDKIKLRAFVRCIKEDGIQRFCGYLKRNADHGVVYHREGIFGDYDLSSEEAVLSLLRTGVPS